MSCTQQDREARFLAKKQRFPFKVTYQNKEKLNRTRGLVVMKARRSKLPNLWSFFGDVITSAPLPEQVFRTRDSAKHEVQSTLGVNWI